MESSLLTKKFLQHQSEQFSLSAVVVAVVAEPVFACLLDRLGRGYQVSFIIVFYTDYSLYLTDQIICFS